MNKQTKIKVLSETFTFSDAENFIKGIANNNSSFRYLWKRCEWEETHTNHELDDLDIFDVLVEYFPECEDLIKMIIPDGHMFEVLWESCETYADKYS